MQNIKVKKRQFIVFQLTEKDLSIDEDRVVTAKLNKHNFVQTSSTLLLRQIENIEKELNIHKTMEFLNETMVKAYNGKEFNADAFVKLTSIDFSKVTKENEDMIEKCITEGFKLNNLSMKFIGAVGGSHVKNVKQFYVQEEIHAEIEKRINLKELEYCIIPKRLTSNALLTTAIWEIPYDLSKLNICILPDNEIQKAFPGKLETLVPYTYADFTEEEKQKHDDFIEYKKMNESYANIKKEYKDKVKNIKDLSLKLEYNSYKTPNRWLKEDNRLVMLEEVENTLYKNAKGKIIYGKNQTRELEHNIFEVAEWSLGYKVVDYNEELSINNFDGFGLCSLELGNYIRSYFNDYLINGFQLRLPQTKGFYSIVDIKKYLKSKGLKYIWDIFGHKWNVDDIDIIATESTFKAKIETDKTGKNKKWMWESYQEYQNKIVEFGYDCLGISNYTHERYENEYRTLTYQFLEALNATEYDLLALSNEHGKMLYNILKIYRENREKGQEINWEDIKYIKCYLQNLIEEKEACEEDYVATALKCINLNKNMIFDKKFTNFLSSEIERELNQLSLGQIKVKSNYLYVTTDVLGFLKYVCQFADDRCIDADYRKDLSKKEIEGTLKENEWFCQGIQGNKVMYRNPLMAQAEIFKPVFVDLSENEEYEYIKHLNNIIQSPMNTYNFQKATYDVDGDKMQLIHLDHNLKNYNLNWLINYDFIPEVQESLKEKDEDIRIELTNLNILEQKMNLYYMTRFKDQAIVTLADLISDEHKIIVNPSDGATIEGQEWNITNIHNFLVNSEDKTGLITDYNTIALNQFNSLCLQDWFTYWFESIYKTNNIEEKFQDYKWTSLSCEELELRKDQLRLTNKYCKFFQGIIIDMSKRGGVVEIAEMLGLIYRKQPTFYELKGKDKDNLGKDYKSHMDRFCKKIQSLNRTIGKLLSSKVRDNITNHQLYFTPQLIQNSKINNTEKLQEIQIKFKDLIKVYSDKMNELIIEKNKINRFSKDDEHKNARLEINHKFKELKIKTQEEAKKVCKNDLVLAQALYQHVYNSEDSKAFSYAWTVAEKGFIYNLQQEQTEKYNVNVSFNKNDTVTFEYFGKKYKLNIDNKKIEYYKDEDLMLDNLGDYMIENKTEKIEEVKLKFVAYKWQFLDDKENYINNLLKDIKEKEFILKEENKFTQLADLQGNILTGIDSKELDYSNKDMPNREGYKIKFKEIERVHNKKNELITTAFIATCDIYK